MFDRSLLLLPGPHVTHNRVSHSVMVTRWTTMVWAPPSAQPLQGQQALLEHLHHPRRHVEQSRLVDRVCVKGLFSGASSAAVGAVAS